MTLLQLLCYNIKFYDDFVLIVRKVVHLKIVCVTGIGRKRENMESLNSITKGSGVEDRHKSTNDSLFSPPR